MKITEDQLCRINYLRERAGSKPVTLETAEILMERMSESERQNTMSRLGDEPKPAAIPLQHDYHRQLDLIRYSRHALHTEGLISNEEYSQLIQIPGAVARLESYDEAIATAKESTAVERERCAKIAREQKDKWSGVYITDSAISTVNDASARVNTAMDIEEKIRSGE